MCIRDRIIGDKNDIAYIRLKSFNENSDNQLIESVKKFENNISNICKTKYCVSLNSGTDALTLGLHLIGVRRGDEVITPPNSFIYSTTSIIHLGAKPVFFDVADVIFLSSPCTTQFSLSAKIFTYFSKCVRKLIHCNQK